MVKSGKKFSLASALKTHQAHAAAIEKARVSQAHREAALKKRSNPQKKKIQSGTVSKELNRPKGKERLMAMPVKWTIPFEQDDRILLIGEGNFSFALALVQTHGIPPQHIVATTLDSEAECYEKYPHDAEGIVVQLRNSGARVLFGVDATKLHKNKDVKSAPGGWNKVVFNFPHVGAGIKDQDRNVLTNQHMLLGFLRSVAPLLSEGSLPRSSRPRPKFKPKGSDSDSDDDEMSDSHSNVGTGPDAADMSVDDEFYGIVSENNFDGDGSRLAYYQRAPARQGVVLITLRESKPYTLWDMPNLAKRPPKSTSNSGAGQPRYTQIRSFRFWPEAYPGYEHRRTKGGGLSEKSLKEEGMGGTGGVCRTWEFVLLKDDKKPEQPESATGANTMALGTKIRL